MHKGTDGQNIPGSAHSNIAFKSKCANPSYMSNISQVLCGHLNMLSLCKDVRQCKEGEYRKNKQRKMSERRESGQFILLDDI